MSLEEIIAQRRSVRDFTNEPLSPEQIRQLCWAGQGITDSKYGGRTVPSAGALYPLELYVLTAEGVDHYLPRGNSFERHLSVDVRRSLQKAAVDQEFVGQAPVTIVMAAVQARMERKYRSRAERYCFIEAGHVAQNILLQAVALGLAGVPVGAFEDARVAKILKLPKGHRVLYFLSLGHPK